MKNLEDKTELCPFAEVCSESNYGNEEICSNDYFDCKLHFKYLKLGIKKYNETKELRK